MKYLEFFEVEGFDLNTDKPVLFESIGEVRNYLSESDSNRAITGGDQILMDEADLRESIDNYYFSQGATKLVSGKIDSNLYWQPKLTNSETGG